MSEETRDEFTAADFEGKTSDEIMALVNGNTKGLVENKNRLLQENIGFKEKVGGIGEIEAKAEAARVQAVNAEAANLETQGKYEEAKELLNTESNKHRAEMENRLKESEGYLSQVFRTQEESGILAHVDPRFMKAAKALLSAQMQTEVTEGKPVHSFIDDGSSVATNSKDFLSWAKDDPTWQQMLKGVESFGAGAKPAAHGAATINTGEKQKHATSLDYFKSKLNS